MSCGYDDDAGSLHVYVYLEGGPRVMSICELEVYGHKSSYPICYIATLITSSCLVFYHLDMCSSLWHMWNVKLGKYSHGAGAGAGADVFNWQTSLNIKFKKDWQSEILAKQSICMQSVSALMWYLHLVESPYSHTHAHVYMYIYIYIYIGLPVTRLIFNSLLGQRVFFMKIYIFVFICVWEKLTIFGILKTITVI